MSALTAPFINDEGLVTKTFVQSLPKVSAVPAVRSRVFPQLDRNTAISGVLRQTLPVPFDVQNPEHRHAWAVFFTQGKWIKRFALELPWDSVPQMVQVKMNAYMADQILCTEDGPDKEYIVVEPVINAEDLIACR